MFWGGVPDTKDGPILFPVRPNGYRHGDFGVSPDNNVYHVAGSDKVVVCNIRRAIIGKGRVSLTAAKRKDSKYYGETGQPFHNSDMQSVHGIPLCDFLEDAVGVCGESSIF